MTFKEIDKETLERYVKLWYDGGQRKPEGTPSYRNYPEAKLHVEGYPYIHIPYWTNPLIEKAMHLAAEEMLGIAMCAYVPRVARILDGMQGWLAESAHDNGLSYASHNTMPTRLELWLTIMAEENQKINDVDQVRDR